MPDAKTGRVKIVFNDATDVVSVFVDGSLAQVVRPSASDNHVLLEFDDGGFVVGVEVFGASVLRPAIWREHPVRRDVPTLLLSELDGWLAHRWADLRRA